MHALLANKDDYVTDNTQTKIANKVWYEQLATFQNLNKNHCTCVNCGLQNWPQNEGRTNCYYIKPAPFCKFPSLTFCFCLGKIIPILVQK